MDSETCEEGSEFDIHQNFMRFLSQRNASLHILPTPSSVASDAPPNACNLHLIPMKDNKNSSTLDIARGEMQYVYDNRGVQYLDCVNGTAHVGHCHPSVVAACHKQMSQLATSQGFTQRLLSRYTADLVDTLPEPLRVCYLTNSGSEANDLALRLAAAYTGNEDIIVVEDGYHGNISSLIYASPKMHPRYKLEKKDHIHIVRLPDMFRGQYRYDDNDAGIKFAQEVENKILQVKAEGRKIAAFLYEPMFVIPGVFIPPSSYYQHVFR